MSEAARALTTDPGAARLSRALDELIPRTDEPCLRSVLEHIQTDAQRHKVIAVESVRALREAGLDRRFIARLFGAVVEKCALLYFRHVSGYHLNEKCRALELPHERILERALDEVADAQREI